MVHFWILVFWSKFRWSVSPRSSLSLSWLWSGYFWLLSLSPSKTISLVNPNSIEYKIYQINYFLILCFLVKTTLNWWFFRFCTRTRKECFEWWTHWSVFQFWVGWCWFCCRIDQGQFHNAFDWISTTFLYFGARNQAGLLSSCNHNDY